MQTKQESFYSMQTVESIISDPGGHWKTEFKEMIISMIASNSNELLWYANFLSRCEYVFHFDESFTSAVYFNGKNFVISINPVILGLLEKDQIIAILKHSAGHIIHHHFSRGKDHDETDREIVEIAKDIVINGSKDLPYIKDLPRTGKYVDSPIGAHFYQTLTHKYGIESYEVGRAFEYYAALIKAAEEEIPDEPQEEQSCTDTFEEASDDEIEMELNAPQESDISSESTQGSEGDRHETNVESEALEQDEVQSESSNDGEGNENPKNGEKEVKSLSERTLEALENGECKIDSHEYGEQLQESVGLDDNVLDSFMDTTLREMIDDATNFARGFTPSEAIEARNAIEKRKSHKDWKKIFNKKMRNYLSNAKRYKEPNKARQHPIYPDDLDLYGYTPSKLPRLGVILDVSGSVNDTLLSALMSEVQAIQKKYSIKSVTLVQVDAAIKSIEKFGVHDKFVIRHGGGGTIMEPGFEVLLKQSRREVPDMIICATDGDIEQRFERVKVPSSVQVIWLVHEAGKLMFDTDSYPKQQMQVIKLS